MVIRQDTERQTGEYVGTDRQTVAGRQNRERQIGGQVGRQTVAVRQDRER